jgi:hypothetical protein
MMEQTIHHHEIERFIFFEFLPVVLAMIEVPNEEYRRRAYSTYRRSTHIIPQIQ